MAVPVWEEKAISREKNDKADKTARADKTDAVRLFEVSAPRSPTIHLISTSGIHQALVVDGSRLFEIDSQTFQRFEELIGGSDAIVLDEYLNQLGVSGQPRIDDHAPERPPVRALSLAVAQKCNLGCRSEERR